MIFIPKRNASLSASQVATITGSELLGNGDARITALCPLNDPEPGAISFCRDSSARKALLNLQSSAVEHVFVAEQLKDHQLPSDKNYFYAADPQAAIMLLVPHFFEVPTSSGLVSRSADVDPSARIAEGVTISAFCAIGKDVVINSGTVLYPQVTIYPSVQIGKNCVIHSGAVLREGVVLGNNCVIQPGAILGGDGFGFRPDHKGNLISIPQIGHLTLADAVEVGANTCIDRAAMGKTSVGTGTKIDNLCQIGHNVKIGRSAIVCGHSAVAGSVTIENGCVLGGSTAVADHLTIAKGVRLGGGATVLQSMLEPGDYMGAPAVPARQWHRMMLALEKLPAFLKQGGSKNSGADE